MRIAAWQHPEREDRLSPSVMPPLAVQSEEQLGISFCLIVIAGVVPCAFSPRIKFDAEIERRPPH
jgi:hypothetical protein